MKYIEFEEFNGPRARILQGVFRLAISNTELNETPMNFLRDYSNSNSVGTRGIKRAYFLSDGIYKIQYHKSWSSVVCYFINIRDGHENSTNNMVEVFEWLKNFSE